MVDITTEATAPAKKVSERAWYPWAVVALLMVIYTCSYIDRTIPSLLVGHIKADFKITDTEYSLLVGFAFVIMYSIAGIPCGWLVDHWSRRGVIIVGVTSWSIMTAMCGLANSYWSLLAARIGVGIGEATLNPAAYSLITDTFRRERLSRAMSLFASATPTGTGLALIVGGIAIEAADKTGAQDFPVVGLIKPWQMVFMMVGLPGLILALIAYFVIKEPPRTGASKSGVAEDTPKIGEVLRYIWAHKKIYGAICFGVSLTTMFGYGTNAWYAAFMMRVHHFSPGETGQILGTSTVILGICGAMTAGWWSDTLAKRGRLDAQPIVGMWYCVGLFVCGALGPIIPSMWMSVALVAISAFFIKTLSGIMAGAIQVVTPNRMRGRVSAIYLGIIALLAQGFGPLTVALATDHVFGYDGAVGYSLALVGAITVPVGFICFAFGRKLMVERLHAMGAAGQLSK